MKRVAKTKRVVRVEGADGDGPVPPADARAVTVGTADRTLQAAGVCSAREEAFASAWVRYRNKGRAYREAYGLELAHISSQHYAQAIEVFNRPHVAARIREIEAAAAASVHVDVGALLEADMQIVHAAAHADQLIWHEWTNCRRCHGHGFKHQYRDIEEFAMECAALMDHNALFPNPALQKKMPSDEGGYGFDPTREPNANCPHCYGRGEQATVVADTRRLAGPAAALYRGMKVSKNGIEVLTHDVDKAKDRLYRAAGMYKDDAASVARGAAAGAAAGAALGAAASRMDTMSGEQAARLYLQLVNA